MKKLLGGLHWIIIIAIIALSLVSGIRDDIEVNQILAEAEQAAKQVDLNADQNDEQSGVASATQYAWHFSTSELQRKIAKFPINRQHYFYTWSGQDQPEVTGSAPGVNKSAYFVNSFLVGFKPFDTKTIWQPLATIALRKTYVLDSQLYGPKLSEIWQNSRQAYAYTRGDCEDHAIILADWLIAMGHEARVVLGKYKNGGHAWVILFIDGKEYVLEATSKRRTRSISDFKIAALATDYHPAYQFDRNKFWVNTGSRFTTQYQGSNWQLRSIFSRRKS